MDFNLTQFLAVFLGYAVPLCLWFVLTRRMPGLWTEGDASALKLPRPWVELGWAFVALALIMGFNVLYNTTGLVPRPAAPALSWLRPWVFPLNLLIIWSPLFLLLWWRRQGLGSCLLSLRGGGKKLLWGIGGALLGMVVYLLVAARGGDMELVVSALWRWDGITALQSVIQFFGFGFLLVRLTAAAGQVAGILICASLYGLVKYPYYMNAYSMGFGEATIIILFSIVVGFLAFSMVYARRDVLVLAIIHVFLDLIQGT